MNTIVVVLGVGRSGTSLLMQVLEALGIHSSRNLIPEHAANKYGSKEDEAIFRIHANLLRDIGTSPQLPLPEDWLSLPATIEARKTLVDIVRDYLSNQSVFSFKDPKVNAFIPLWNQIFNELRIIPIYLFAARDYNATAASFKRQYNSPEKDIEATWLCRTLDGLYNCGLDCHIIHYEDWFKHPERTLLSLKDYLKDFGIETKDINIHDLLDHSANHTLSDSIETKNKLILDIQSVLRDCRGHNFDKNTLADIVKAGRQQMSYFGAWSSAAHKAIRARNHSLKKLEDLRARVAELEKIKAESSFVEEERRRLKELSDELKSCARNLDKLTLI